MEETIHSASANSFTCARVFIKTFTLAALILIIGVLPLTSSFACPSPTTSFPISEDFESDAFANWTHDPSDDFNWVTHTGSTTSSNTGPSSAYNGSYYAYTEATSPNNPDKVANLISPCFSVQSGYNTEISFAYHMYGSGMGDFNVDITTNDGSSWTNLWSLTGNQGNVWQTNSIDLSAYAGQDVKLRFNVITGTYQSDVSIDDVVITSVANEEHWLEAECAVIGANWNTVSDVSASNDSYVTVQSGNNSYNSAPTGVDDRITFNVTISTAGNYNIFGRVQGATSDDDSFWVRANGGTWYKWNSINQFAPTSFEWGQVYDSDNGNALLSFALSAGLNTIDFAYREDGALLDKVMVGLTSTAPTGEGNSSENCPEICGNSVDDDGDLAIDQDDPDCFSCSSGLLTNPDFQNDLTSWANWGFSSITTEPNGNKYASVSGGVGGFGQDVAASEGDEISLTFKAKKLNNSSASAGFAIYDASWTKLTPDQAVTITSDNFQQYTITYTMPANTAWVQAFAWNGDAAGELHIDGYCLTKSTSGTCNLLSNIEFDNGTNDWTLSNTSPASSILSIDNSSQLSGANSAFIDIVNSTGTNWHTQFRTTNPLSIDASKTYNISFEAKATTNKVINVSLQQNVSPYSTYYYSSDITVGTSAQTYYIPNVTMSGTGNDALFKFYLNIDDTDIWIDNVVFEELNCSELEVCEACVGENLFDNPGFESGSFIGADVFVTGVNSDNLGTNWGTPSGLDGWSHGPLYWVETTKATEGNKAVYLNNASGGAVCQGQYFDLGDGLGQISTCSDYRLCFDWASFNRDYPSGRSDESRPSLDLTWFDINGTDIGVSHQDLGTATANQDWNNLSWTNVSYVFSLTGGLTPPANAHSVRVNISEAGGYDNGILFDNTSLCVSAPCFSGFDTEKCYLVSDGQTSGSDTQDTMYTFNYVTSAVEAIGPTGTYRIEAIAMDTINKKIYASSLDLFGLLDISSGLFHTISADMGSLNGAEGVLNISDVDGMTYDHTNNIIWATERRTLSNDVDGSPDDLLLQIDPVTGLVIQDAFGANVGYLVINTPENDLDDIALSDDGTLYAISNFGASGNQSLGIINKVTGVWTEIGDYGIEDVESLAFTATGQLIATTGKDGDQKDQLFTIDAGTGIATFVGSIDPAHDVEGCDCISASLINLQIGDKVWADLNSDGLQGIEEPGVSGVVVNLLTSTGSPYLDGMGVPMTSTTDAFGNYLFDGLPEGQYRVQFILPSGTSFSTKNVGSDDDIDSDANTTTGQTDIVTLANSTNDLSVDAGLLNANVVVRDCDDYGDLFVADDNGNIMRFDQNTGAFIDNFIQGLNGPIEMVVGSDDWLYVSSSDDDEVRKYSLTTGVLVGTISGDLYDPHGLTVGPDGHIYVNNDDLDEVVKLEVPSGTTSAFTVGAAGGLDGNKWGIEFGPDGNLYVTSFYTDEVLRYNGTTGAFMDVFVAANTSYINAPSDLTFGPDGHLYVAGRYNDLVAKYNGTTGAYMSSFVTYQSGGLQDPVHINFGEDGYFYVSSKSNSIGVLKYNGTTGAFIENFAAAPGPNGTLFAPVPGCPGPCYNDITISNVNVSSCIDHPLRDVATVTMDVSWSNPPSNESIFVTIGNKTEEIDVPGGSTSPYSITFNVIADGSTNNSISATWETTIDCDDIATFDSPGACSNDELKCDILYLCGLDKPYDGDAYDHGWIEYLDDINGTNSVTAILTKDEPGMGTYDPMNTSTFINVNLSDYDLVIISATTEGHISSDFVNVLKDIPTGLLNGNYLLTDDLGLSLSNGGTTWGSSAYIDNTTQEEIYNYDNPNSWSGKLFTTADYEAYGEGHLWGQSNGMTNTNHGISVAFEASDVLPGISNAHGARVSFGYHMNGIYANNDNNGIIPSPVSAWFTPENHLTLIGKEKFDEALLLAAAGCCPVTPVSITGPDNICVGSTTTLSPTTGGTWSSSDDNIAIVSNNGTVSAVGAGKVVFTYTESTSLCSTTTTDSITVNPDLTTSINFNGSICLEDDSQLSAEVSGGTAGFQFQWTGPNSFTSTDSIISITDDGNYNVTVTDAAGCSSNTTAFVYEQYEPFIFTLNSEVCEGEDVTLSVSGASGGTYQWDANANNATSSSVTVTPGLPSTTYTVTVTNSIGCTTSATAVIDVIAKPVVSVTGSNDICVGATTQLSPSSGGIWTSSNYSVANVSNTGLVTGTGSGSVNFTFKDNVTGCFSDPTSNITVNDNITPTISGEDQICLGENPTLTASVIGGTWSSDNTAIATINSSTGVITPVSQGSVVITYTPPSSGCYTNASYNINTYDEPTLTLNGPATICEGSLTYISASTSGTWTSSDESVAVVSNIGEVTAVGPGTATFSFVSVVGCTGVLGTPITVVANPIISLTGPSDICIDETTTLSPTSGGVWISSNTSIATISNSGVVTGKSAGNASFTFIESTYGCVSENNVTVTVNAPPNITSPSTNSLCIGETASITPTSGGVWNSSDATVASISNDGTITALSDGTVTFSFTSNLTGCTSTASTPITVQPKPTTNFSGPTSICQYESTSILPNVGGFWSSTDVSIATITNQGIINGVSPGTVRFIFTNGNSGCVSDSSDVLTVVQPATVNVSGPSNICVGETSTLTPNTGGTWTSSNTNVATVTNGGIITAISPGTVTFIFENGSGCSSEPTEEVVIENSPTVTYLGATSICIGEVTTLSPSTGGTWSTSNSAVATISNSGVATAVAAGSVTFTFTNSTTGCSATTSADLVVNSPPTISISGNDEICIGETTQLQPSFGGAWISSDNSIASIMANGTVTGLNAGNVTFTFIETATGCSSEASAPVTILPRPDVTIDGSNTICVGSTTNLTPSTGGTWVSDNESVATVTNSGVVTGVGQGLARFTFTSTEGCASNETAPVIVFDSPNVLIDGPSSICVDETVQLLPSSGGTWSSANTTIASIDNSGLVTALMPGTTTFTFTDANTGCVSDPSDPITIEASPVISLIGPSEICIGSTTNMSPSTGGVWTSLNPLVATIQNNGEIVGIGAGEARFLFMNLATGCVSDTSSAITVLSGPAISFNGPTEICLGDTTYILPSSGGVWESTNPAVATITNAGMIIGVAEGITRFQFTETSSNCKSELSEILTVNGPPTVGVTGPSTICLNSTTNLSPSSGGTWESLNPGIASVDANGVVTGLTEGTAYFIFTDDYTGCVSDGNLSIEVQTSPQIGITGDDKICLGYTTTLSPSISGMWTSSNPAIATVSNTGVVTGHAPGVVTFQFMDPITGCTSNGWSDPVTIVNCTNHDFNVTLKNEIVFGDLNTNDKANTAVYGGVIETLTKPLSSLPILTVNADGTYSFESNKAGKYLYRVPVCMPPVLAGCEGTLLEINVVEDVYTVNSPIANLEFTTTYTGALSTDPGDMVVIDAIANDTCVYAGACSLDETTLALIGTPSNGTAVTNGNYKIEYTPDPNFVGLDTINYSVCLSDGITCAQSQEIVIVNHTSALNSTVANDDFFYTMRETTVVGNVLNNDMDPEGELISAIAAGTALNPVVIPEGSYYLTSNGDFSFTPNEDFFGTADITYTICDNQSEPYCTDATIHLLVLNDMSLQIRVYLEGALIYNDGAETQSGLPLMRDDLRVSPFTGENHIPLSDPYTFDHDPFIDTENRFVKMGAGMMTKNQFITDSLGVFSVEGDNAIVDWIHVEIRSKTDNTQVIGTRSGLVQRDGDVVDLNGTSSLRFQNLHVDSFYVVVKHRSHLGVMSELVTNEDVIDFTDLNFPVFNFGTTYGNGFDYTGLSRKNSVVYGHAALWAGDFDSNGKVKFTNPDDDQNLLFLGVLFSSPEFLINYDNAYGYFTSDFDMNGKSKYTNPNDDLNLLFSQILLYPLNTSFLSNFSSLIEQIPE